MTSETPSKPTKICPTCGTRANQDAIRCIVCGADLETLDRTVQPSKGVQGSRIPSISLSLPAAIGLMALFLIIGAVLVYFALRSTPDVIVPSTSTVTVTITSTPSLTPTQLPPTLTLTPEPSPTPVTYLVQLGDTCLGIAAFFGVSVQSIVTLNNLPAACDNLTENQPLLIPHPTPTVTPLPSATLSDIEETEVACEKVEYEVQENDTLGSISTNYGVPMDAIREENGLPGDTVLLGQKIIIPLCRRASLAGPTATPTAPPPYPAPNLLLPVDGAPFSLSDDTVTLQWASVGTLRENEAYIITLFDTTAGTGEKLVDYATDTKYLLQSTLRPTDSVAHIFRWSVGVVRQVDTDDDGNPIWESAGALSEERVFSWINANPQATPVP